MSFCQTSHVHDTWQAALQSKLPMAASALQMLICVGKLAGQQFAHVQKANVQNNTRACHCQQDALCLVYNRQLGLSAATRFYCFVTSSAFPFTASVIFFPSSSTSSAPLFSSDSNSCTADGPIIQSKITACCGALHAVTPMPVMHTFAAVWEAFHALAELPPKLWQLAGTCTEIQSTLHRLLEPASPTSLLLGVHSQSKQSTDLEAKHQWPN